MEGRGHSIISDVASAVASIATGNREKPVSK
jgi:hypothetical protein